MVDMFYFNIPTNKCRIYTIIKYELLMYLCFTYFNVYKISLAISFEYYSEGDSSITYNDPLQKFNRKCLYDVFIRYDCGKLTPDDQVKMTIQSLNCYQALLGFHFLIYFILSNLFQCRSERIRLS